jgi:hypothetical protein
MNLSLRGEAEAISFLTKKPHFPGNAIHPIAKKSPPEGGD